MTPEERDAGIRADIASGQFSDTEIAARWQVHRSSVFYKRHQRPGRTSMVTEKGSTPDVALTPAPFTRERAKAIRKWIPYREYVAGHPSTPPPLPMTTKPAAVLRTPEWKARNTLTNQEATRARHDLEVLGWRAECVSLGDNLCTVEVRDMSQRHMPLVARLRTMKDVLRFEGMNPRCPPRGRALPESVTPGSRPWSKNKRDKDQEQHWPPMASLTSGAVHHANDLDY